MRLDDDGMIEVEQHDSVGRLLRVNLTLVLLLILLMSGSTIWITVQLLRASQARDAQIASMVEMEEHRRMNFELLAEYIVCVGEMMQAEGDPRTCPVPEFQPPPGEVDLVPRDDPRTGVTIPPEAGDAPPPDQGGSDPSPASPSGPVEPGRPPPQPEPPPGPPEPQEPPERPTVDDVVEQVEGAVDGVCDLIGVCP